MFYVARHFVINFHQTFFFIEIRYNTGNINSFFSYKLAHYTFNRIVGQNRFSFAFIRRIRFYEINYPSSSTHAARLSDSPGVRNISNDFLKIHFTMYQTSRTRDKRIMRMWRRIFIVLETGAPVITYLYRSVNRRAKTNECKNPSVNEKVDLISEPIRIPLNA